MNVAVQYNHRLDHVPDIKAGAKERAGFIDAPDIKDKKNISSPTIPPIAIPPKPLRPFVCTTINITIISNAVASISIPNIKGSGYE